METIHLMGADDVHRAGHTIAGAAETMKQTMGTLDDILFRHQRFMDDWLQRLTDLMEEYKETK